MTSVTRTNQHTSANRFLVPLLLSMTLVAFPAMADDDDDDRRGKWRQQHGNSDRDDRRDWRDDRKRWDHQQRDRYQRENQWQREQAYRYEQQRRLQLEQQRRWQIEQQRRYNSAYYNSRYNSGYYPRTVVRHNGPPAWARGRDYRSYGYNNVYQVPYSDYDRYGLYQPGYGQQWLRDDGGNYLLIAAATGIISSIFGGR